MELEEICGDFIEGNAQRALVDIEGPVFPYDNEAALTGLSFPSGAFGGYTVEYPGSGSIGSMVDLEGLSRRSLNSLVPGRYIVQVIDGFSEETGRISGQVLASGVPLFGAIVQTCTETEDFEVPLTRCQSTTTDEFGAYEVAGAPLGTYRITASGPANTDLFPASVTATVDSVFGPTFADDINLEGPEPLPGGVTLSPTSDWGLGTTVYWGDPLNLSVTGCEGGTGTWMINADDGPARSGPLAASGTTYSAIIPPLNPTHGRATLVISITGCPNPTDDTEIEVSLYIDPSGTIFELHSGEPIDGATVTLTRSENAFGPFVAVPDGSNIMSPTNRVNPFLTGPDGRFGWDVVEGFYVVNATKEGCNLVNDDGLSSSTAVLEVEPEWLGLELFLDCNNAPTISTVATITAEAPRSPEDLRELVSVNDLDPADVLEVTVEPSGPLPLGENEVTWTVTDGRGGSASTTQTVTVVDTTAPVVTVPDDLRAEARFPDGTTVVFDADLSALDSVDGALPVTCDPPSGTRFPLGTTTVACTAVDSSGNVGTNSFTVEFVDSTAPANFVAPAITIESPDGEPVAVEFTITATDTIDGEIIARCTPAPGSMFLVGETTVECRAVDLSENERDRQLHRHGDLRGRTSRRRYPRRNRDDCGRTRWHRRSPP